MTTTIFRADSLETRRTNTVRNPRAVESGPEPSPATGYAGAFVDDLDQDLIPGLTTGYRYTCTSAGAPLNAMFDGPPTTHPEVTPGQLVGGGVLVVPSRSGVELAARIRYGEAGGLWVAYATGPTVVSVAGQPVWLYVNDVVPAGAARAMVSVYMGSAAVAVGDAFTMTAGILDLANYPPQVPSAYFDGDTIDPTGLHSYQWSGEPNASPSVELEPNFRVDPQLVLNYAEDRPTGVTVHDTILGGAPVIVRLPSRRLQRGTFEFFTDWENEAYQIANICDGRTNVVLVSDDVPEAPFTFCPTDSVRIVWNSPYKSWTVTVPYVRMSF